MRELTDRQRQVFEFIRDYQEQHGYPPSFKEVGESMGINSPNGVMVHMRALERKGKIRRTDYVARGIEILDRPQRGIPLLTLKDLKGVTP